MNKVSQIFVIFCFSVFTFSTLITASTKIDNFKIEGIISAASIKALPSELKKRLEVNILDLNLKGTDSGWPVLRVEYNSEIISKEKIENVIGEIEDPAGHKYKVHKGPLIANAALIDEENKAMTVLGDITMDLKQVTNPTVDFDSSIKRGKDMFVKNCAKCHGLNGNGYGVVAHGFATWPRQLWVWYKADSAADSYLFWILENGKSDMPPWGLILSENERWDLINYIKTIKKPD
tara:strand:- start:31 stop:732 length:702 start_codon:yes stop_codon:yes gene_type:complete